MNTKTWCSLLTIGLAGVWGMALAGIVEAQPPTYGKLYWEPTGVPLCVAPEVQGIPHVTTDETHGIIVTWSDGRDPKDFDIYAQRVLSDGQVAWQLDGALVNKGPDHQLGPRIISDGAGGALIAWTDGRMNPDRSVFAQHIDSTGKQLWNSQGITIVANPGQQILLNLIPDGLGGGAMLCGKLCGPCPPQR
jgi:hypothetical protein